MSFSSNLRDRQSNICFIYTPHACQASWTDVLVKTHAHVAAYMFDVRADDSPGNLLRYLTEVQELGIPVFLDGLGDYVWGENSNRDSEIHQAQNLCDAFISKPWARFRSRVDFVDCRKSVEAIGKRFLKASSDFIRKADRIFDGVARSTSAGGVVLDTTESSRLLHILQQAPNIEWIAIDYRTCQLDKEGVESVFKTLQDSRTQALHCVYSVEDIRFMQIELQHFRNCDTILPCSVDEMDGNQRRLLSRFCSNYLEREAVKFTCILYNQETLPLASLIGAQSDVDVIEMQTEHLHTNVLALSFNDGDMEEWLNGTHHVSCVLVLQPNEEIRIVRGKGKNKVHRKRQYKPIDVHEDDEEDEEEEEEEDEVAAGDRPSFMCR